MIDIGKLYCGGESTGDAIRYGQARQGQQAPKAAHERRPVTVWNVTRTCNLRCIHCYTDSEAQSYSGELTTEEGRELLRDLADFGVPAVLFSGGEPLMRKDLFELVEYAVELGLRPTLSTNGTLIDPATARRIQEAGFTYVGISLDGIGEINDRFRGKEGAFDRAVTGFRNCVEVGQRVGLRLTLTRHNYEDLHGIFDFIEAERVDRACFYHLAYAGRGRDISGDDLSRAETRRALDIILERTEDYYARGLEKNILTVDNHVDGVYLYLKLREKDPGRAEEVLKLLRWNGGGRYSSGVGIADIDFMGNVHADQFWMHYSFGNVRERKFSEIWMDTGDALMAGLKDRLPLIKGRCARCRWLDACGGALRVRADVYYDDPWAPDPACYLSDDEIGLTEEVKQELRAAGEWFEMPAFGAETDSVPSPS
ncbi:MAG: radical SAM protein [Armatimonadota bacterium]